MEIHMNAIKWALFAAFAAVVAGSNALAEPVVVRGEELRNLILTEKGTTWVLSNETQTQISFLPGNKVYACEAQKTGWSDCDSGTFTVTESSIETRLKRLYSKSDGTRTALVKKDGDNLMLDGFEVIQYTRIPTLFPPSREETPLRKKPVTADERELLKKASEALLQRDVFSIGTEYTLSADNQMLAAGGKWRNSYDAHPKQGYTFFNVNSNPCFNGRAKTEFSVDQDGFLVLNFVPNLHDCTGMKYIFHPITGQGQIRFIDPITKTERVSSNKIWVGP
jgi:hypothetical protein